jgi:hypothetical protein
MVWSKEGTQCALLINGQAHAAFDFAAERGYGRRDFPNLPDRDQSSWPSSDHSWTEDAITWLKYRT